MRFSLPEPAACDLPFPFWRPAQAEAISRTLDSRRKFIGISAPTGIGKTGIALALAQIFEGPGAMLTATKVLQDAYAEVTPDLTIDLRGAGNYECLAAQDQFKKEFRADAWVGCDDGPCRVGSACTRKREGGCLFYDHEQAVLERFHVVTSYDCWLARHRFGKGLGYDTGRYVMVEDNSGHEKRVKEILGRQWLICDEAHDAGAKLAEHLEASVGSWEFGRFPPRPTLEAWRSWARLRLQDATEQAESASRVKDRLKAKRDADRLRVVVDLTTDWVWEVDGRVVRFGPVRVADYTGLIWQKVNTVVLMSATLTLAECARLGIPRGDLTWISLPSPFPVDRRLVYVLTDAARLDQRSEQRREVRDWWVEQIDDILEARQDRKGVVHTVSYQRCRYLLEHSKFRRRMITHDSARELAEQLEQFREAGPGAIFVSPSVVTGVDFPYETCEYQVIAKLPFPNLSGALAKARLKADPGMREIETMRKLVQAIGRGMRAVDDRCESLIVDGHAKWFLKRYRHLAPDWFMEAVRRVDRVPTPPPKLERHAVA